MPLKRTPPPSVSPLRGEAEPDVAAPPSSRPESKGVTLRQKRPREEITMGDFMDSMKSMFKDFKDEQNRKFDSLQGSIAEYRDQQEKRLDCLQNKLDEICKQNEDIRNSIEFLSQENSELKSKVNKMESERKEDSAYVRLLETKIDNLERQNRSASIEIRNIPVPKSETKEDLMNVLQKISKALKVDLAASDVSDIFRVSTKVLTNKPIVCNLNSVLLKERLLKGLKDFNNTHKANRFSTEHINIQGTSQPIFISENLTPKMRRLFFLARSFAGSSGYSFCWISRGQIYLRKKEGEKTIRIDSEADLSGLEKTT
ncbi:uncharacterized protein LOC135087407 [Ostrinia nubilalis]|uniref:uncharacterized protein LOC135087407 n=1 Tax=Ostrinia nubilalis TaxID=29057 RepID=UPI00308259B6